MARLKQKARAPYKRPKRAAAVKAEASSFEDTSDEDAYASESSVIESGSRVKGRKAADVEAAMSQHEEAFDNEEDTSDSSAFGVEPGTKKRKITQRKPRDAPMETTPVPDRFKPWKNVMRLASGADLTQISQFNPKKSKFTQVIEVENEEQFVLQPLVFNEGPLKGRRFLLVDPVEITEFFPLMKLPTELRLAIYEALLVPTKRKYYLTTYKPPGLERRVVQEGFRETTGEANPHKALMWDKSVGKWLHQEPSNFSLLQVSKDVAREAASIAYGKVRFEFHSIATLSLFERKIGANIAHVKEIGLGSIGQYLAKWLPHTGHNLLSKASSLQTVAIEHRGICNNFNTTDHGLDRLVALLLPMLRTRENSPLGNQKAIDVTSIVKFIQPPDCDHPLTEVYAFDDDDDEDDDQNHRQGEVEGCGDCRGGCFEYYMHCSDVSHDLRNKIRKVFGKEETWSDTFAEVAEVMRREDGFYFHNYFGR